jgi:hypothetical protein
MDAFLFIGYRIDCHNEDIDIWDMDNKIPDCYPCGGFDVNKYDWGYWPSTLGWDSYLFGKRRLFYGCPMGHHELWSKLEEVSFDLPVNHDEIIKEIESSPIYARLKELYGEQVHIRFGIFKGAG